MDSPKGGGVPKLTPDAIAAGDWLLYPSVRVYSLYSDNLFQSPVNPLSVLGFGTTPGLKAVWSNGIHTTTIDTSIDRQVFPTHNEVNTFDPHVNLVQKYEPLRDLTFRLSGDYQRKTISSALQSSIPSPAGASGGTLLPDGNTLLPNGTIISPTGQVVSQGTPTTTANGSTSSVNPFDQLTSSFFVDKVFNRGILSLSASVAKQDFENSSAQNLHSRSFTENGGVWLGPLFYAYSNGSVATSVQDATSVATTSYRLVGGIGTRQFGLFRGSGYFGHQGSNGQGSAGGDVYGGALTYYPAPDWTLSANVDETINIASQAFTSPLALTFPGATPLQIPLGSSTRITSSSFRSDYHISPQWLSTLQIGYTRIEYVDSTRLDNTWLIDTTLEYDIWHNMALTWEYRYNRISSNVPFMSSISNLATMGAAYKF